VLLVVVVEIKEALKIPRDLLGLPFSGFELNRCQ
jgi:hypothetical protein